MATKPTTPDWERIEREYRAGIKSVREIAAGHGVSHTAIQKRAKTQGWERDLKAKIKAKADAKVAKAAVAKEVSAETKVAEAQLIEANAQAIATVRLEHRTDIRRTRALVQKMLGELEHQTDHADLFLQLGELLHAPDDNGRDRLSELYHRVIGLSGRVSNLKALAESLKHLIALEREAWGLEESEKPPGDVADLTDDDLDRRIQQINERLGYQRAG